MIAEGPDPAHPYPASDTPLTLPSGTVVRVRNVVVFHGRHARRLTIVIETPTERIASTRLADEARELAEMHQEFADSNQLDGVTVMVCRTQACLELREPTTEMFHFVRAAGGGWTSDRQHP